MNPWYTAYAKFILFVGNIITVSKYVSVTFASAQWAFRIDRDDPVFSCRTPYLLHSSLGPARGAFEQIYAICNNTETTRMANGDSRA